MIHIDHVRISFRGGSGSKGSAQRVAKLAMEQLERLSASDVRVRGTSRVLDRAVCEPLRIPASGYGEDAIAEFAAARAWQTILRRV